MKQVLALGILVTVFAVGLVWALRSNDRAETPGATALAPPAPSARETPGATAAATVRQPAPVPENERQEIPLVPAHADCPQGVHGTAVDRQGAPLAGVRAFLIESASNDPIERFQNLARKVPLPPAAAAVTGAEGRFRLGLRAPTDRDYEVYLLADGFAEVRIGDLRLHENRWQDLGPITLEQGSTILGRVLVDGTELPVPDATITLDSIYPLADVALADLPGGRHSRSAVVDATGHYRIEHAPRSGAFRLTAAAPGFARLVRSNIELQPGQPTTVDFALQRGLTIGGWIFGTDGQPVAEARIEAWPTTPEPAYRGTVAADGRFQVAGLREGSYRLHVQAERFQPRDLAEVAAGTQDLRIELAPRASAAILVRTPEGQVQRGYHLSVRRFFAESGGQIAAVHDVPDRTVRLPPHEDLAVVEGLDPGTAEAPAVYAFHLRAEGFALTLSPPFTPGPTASRPTVEVTLTRGGAIHGRVVDEGGRPVGGAEITTQPAGAVEENPVWRMLASLTPDRITRASASTAADGSFVLPRLAHADYQLDVAHADYCKSRRTPVQIDGDHDVAIAPIVLRRGTLVRGRTFVDGLPRSQVRVVLTPAPGTVEPATKTADETLPVRVEAVSDPDGTYVLPRRIPPGLYELRAAIQVGNDPQNEVLQQLSQLQRSAVTIAVPVGQETLEQDIRLQVP